MPSATRFQIFDVAVPCLVYAKTKKPFQIIDLERLGVGREGECHLPS